MEVDIQIYLSNLRTFFKNNPDDLFTLIGNNDSEEFYYLIEKKSLENLEKGDGIELTKNQIMEIVYVINRGKEKELIEKAIMKGPLGDIFLN